MSCAILQAYFNSKFISLSPFSPSEHAIFACAPVSFLTPEYFHTFPSLFDVGSSESFVKTDVKYNNAKPTNRVSLHLA